MFTRLVVTFCVVSLQESYFKCFSETLSAKNVFVGFVLVRKEVRVLRKAQDVSILGSEISNFGKLQYGDFTTTNQNTAIWL